MSDLFKLKKNNSNLKKIYNVDKGSHEIGKSKHYIPADKEWFNSIYCYNKNTIKLLPVVDKVLLRFVKSYFNLFSSILESKAKFLPVRKRFRRLSTNKFLVSRAELKHTNDKIIVTVYLYNRQITYYLTKLLTITSATKYNNIDIYNNLLKYVKKESLNITSKVCNQKNKLAKILGKDVFSNYEKVYLKNLYVKSFKNEILMLYYHQIVALNVCKFDKNNILPLTNLIGYIYNKKIEFNLVDLGYLYLNSYIFSETLVKKIKIRKNKLLEVLKASLLMFNMAPLNKLTVLADVHSKKSLQNLKVNYTNYKHNSNIASQAPSNIYKRKCLNNNHLIFTNNILESIRHKSVTGIRIEASGRLTRRYTAERSVYKVKYKGNIKNMDSSYKGFSTTLLRGHAKSNVQYTKLNSKLRIGSFGIKGWVSSN